MAFSRPALGELPDNAEIILYLIYLSTGWLTIRSVYRLWFHPLRRIPGPKLAAMTHLYELYFDAIRGGKYLREIDKMHEQYGPIVRINPREVHIKDSDFFHTIYAGGKRDRDPKSYMTELLPTSVVSTVSHDHHKLRRRIVEGFFSKLSVRKLDGMMRDKIRILLRRLDRARLSGAPVELHSSFTALTSDIISEYVYGESLGYLDADTSVATNNSASTNTIADALVHTIRWLHYVRAFPSVLRLAWLVPTGLFRGDQSLLGPFLRLLQLTRDKATECLGSSTTTGTDANDKGQKTIFSAMVAESVPPAERSIERLIVEPVTMLVAGTDTTARAASVALFHLANNPLTLRTLRKELFEAFPVSADKASSSSSSCSWSERDISISSLEKLPYLTAVIHESLRVAQPVFFRSPRLAAEPLTYKGVVIPPGTPMSQSLHFVCMDPTIFPSPKTFNPARWIEATANGVKLTKYLATFGVGPRSCLGIHLAYAELYHLIAAFACSFEWEPHETRLEDVQPTRDFHLALPENGSLAIKVLLTGTVG
ncbi:cytochrome P450 [Aspergillus carlsbadensis]|nr:cytochrome P450 [Aspergillus carlsbadensis]